MPKHHPDNERIKRRYLTFMTGAKGHSVQTADAVAAALARFEADTKYRDFRRFHFEQALAFKRRLADQVAQRSGERLSKATLHATLGHLKRFFQWLSDQPGYKSTVQYCDAEYFSLSEKDSRIASARRERPVPTVEQIKHVLVKMPSGTDIERRNRALIAFALLTGARDGAIASFKLKHVDLARQRVYQDARDVRTKFSKTFTTVFFPVGDDIVDIVDIVVSWVRHLREDRLWGNDAPLFPATRVAADSTQRFQAVGLDCVHWSTATPIRAIFQQAFIAAGLPYFNPHSFRNTLVRLGQDVCKTPEEFKAWSQNLGHDHVLTTLLSYGHVDERRQSEIIRGLGRGQQLPESFDAAVADAVVRALRERRQGI